MVDPIKSFVDGIQSFIKYIGDALGVTPDEPPIVADNPPVHSVNGEIKLGTIHILNTEREQSKHRHPSGKTQ